MDYRFIWDTEPTDLQLYTLMEEVGRDVQKQTEWLNKSVLENIHKEMQRVMLCN